MLSLACSKGETSARWWSSWLEPPRLHARTHCQYRGPHCPLRHIYGGLRVRKLPPRRFGERATCFAPCAAGKLLRRRWMPGEYAGHLRTDDPLHGYLSRDVLPGMGVTARQVDFRVFCLKETKVYRYEESHSRTQVVGKFFVNGSRHGSVAMERMRREFENLQVLRGYGLAGYPHHVVRPLGTNESLNSILVEEYCGGAPLSAFIDAAIHQERRPQLFAKLTALAYFLATLHNRTANGHGVDFSEDCAYLDRLVKTLEGKHIIGTWDAEELHWLRDLWREKPRMWEDRQVFVHGDATPSNFLFGEGLSVMAIDLERMRRADRVFDLGRIAGELKHFYLQATGNKWEIDTMSTLRTLWSGFTVLLALTAFSLAAQPPAQPPAGGRGPARFGAQQGLPPTYANIDYAPPEPASSNGHKLDLYIPAGAAQPLPTVIWTAGSAWPADTGKNGARIVASQLNPAGYVVAGVSIRSSAQVKFPGQLHDIKAAIRWLRANAARYNLDPDHIAIMGDSSGGWTTAMAAVTGDAPEMEGSVGTTGVSSAVQAAVAFYPPTNFLTMDRSEEHTSELQSL